VSEDYVSIGEIVNTHGNRGAVRAIPLTDFPERFEGMDSVTVYKDGKRVKLHPEESFRHKRFVILKFREIGDMAAAEELNGALLQVRRDELVELPPGHYYLFQIVGLKVYLVDGEYLGTVTDVLQTGAHDLYVVDRGAPKPVLIPARKEVVRGISLNEGRMIVDLPDGLLEL